MPSARRRSDEPPAPDPADEAMVARARERFAAEGRGLKRRARKGRRRGTLPNLIVIGGLKCGTTSLHHYLNLHPEIAMSRPKELNFFVSELNWELGPDWYASHFDAGARIRGETSPHYTNLPRFRGVATRMAALVPEARLVYMVRDPVDRVLSHYVHNVSGGYETRPLEVALADVRSSYVQRSRYASQLEPYLDQYGPERIRVVSQAELGEERQRTMRELFGFLGVDEGFESPQFSREWETGGGKVSGRFRLLDRAVRAPGLRALDRNFDRLPESLRWMVERLVHDPESGPGHKPALPAEIAGRLEAELAPEVERLAELTGRSFGWLSAERAD